MTPKTLSLALILMLLLSASAGAPMAMMLSVPSCSTIIQDVAPCIGFIKGSMTMPSSNCCAGARIISDSVKNKDDRQAVCNCLKSALSSIGPYDPMKLPQLSSDCKLSVKIPPIDNNTDCTTASVSDFVSSWRTR